MEIHREELGDVTRYIDSHRHLKLEDKEKAYENLLRYIRRVRPVDASVRMLEVGTGTGWFPLLCKKNGLRCKGLEISPQLVAFAREVGKRYGIEPDIELGNLEETDLGEGKYDVIVCNSVFEHVERWREGLAIVYRALAPGGVLLFESTNKFSFTSGEWPAFPVYGWLPDAARYQLRMWVHGKDIMKLGIDFHQFRYPLLRRTFKDLGFTRILDRVDLINPAELGSSWKRSVATICKTSPIAKHTVLTFFDATTFICIK